MVECLGHEVYLELSTFSLRSKRIQFGYLRDRGAKRIESWGSKHSRGVVGKCWLKRCFKPFLHMLCHVSESLIHYVRILRGYARIFCGAPLGKGTKCTGLHGLNFASLSQMMGWDSWEFLFLISHCWQSSYGVSLVICLRSWLGFLKKGTLNIRMSWMRELAKILLIYGVHYDGARICWLKDSDGELPTVTLLGFQGCLGPGSVWGTNLFKNHFRILDFTFYALVWVLESRAGGSVFFTFEVHVILNTPIYSNLDKDFCYWYIDKEREI